MKGKGNYGEQLEKAFTILPKNLGEVTVSVPEAVAYKNSEQTIKFRTETQFIILIQFQCSFAVFYRNFYSLFTVLSRKKRRNLDRGDRGTDLYRKSGQTGGHCI